MSEIAGAIAITIFGIGVFVCVIIMLYSFGKMLSEISPKKDKVSQLLPWLVPFVPWFLTDKGKEHQARFIFYVLLSAVFVGVIFVIQNI